MGETSRPGRRGSVRPGAPRRSGPARAQRHSRPDRRQTTPPRRTASGHALTFTSRAAMLGLTLCAVVLMLAYPTKQYLGQRASISAAHRQQAQLQAQIQSLTRQHAAASDPAQIEALARARLHYTLPGTRNYIQVVPPAAVRPAETKTGNATVPTNPDGSWYGSLWASDQTAGS